MSRRNGTRENVINAAPSKGSQLKGGRGFYGGWFEIERGGDRERLHRNPFGRKGLSRGTEGCDTRGRDRAEGDGERPHQREAQAEHAGGRLDPYVSGASDGDQPMMARPRGAADATRGNQDN